MLVFLGSKQCGGISCNGVLVLVGDNLFVEAVYETLNASVLRIRNQD